MTNFEPFKMVTTINLKKRTGSAVLLLLIVSVFGLYACQGNKKPDGILDEQAFSKVLVEFYLSEARLNMAPIQRDSAMKLFLPHERAVLEKLKISDEVLARTYQYYVSRPDEFEKVYDIVIDSLMLQESKARRYNQPI